MNNFYEVDKDNLPKFTVIEHLEPSDWRCYLFGGKPDNPQSFIYTHAKDNVLNFFTRWMMKICLGCTWVKNKEKNGD